MKTADQEISDALDLSTWQMRRLELIEIVARRELAAEKKGMLRAEEKCVDCGGGIAGIKHAIRITAANLQPARRDEKNKEAVDELGIHWKSRLAAISDCFEIAKIELEQVKAERDVAIQNAHDSTALAWTRKKENDQLRKECVSWKQLHDTDELCINNQMFDHDRIRKCCDDLAKYMKSAYWSEWSEYNGTSHYQISNVSYQEVQDTLIAYSYLPHVIKDKGNKR